MASLRRLLSACENASRPLRPLLDAGSGSAVRELGGQEARQTSLNSPTAPCHERAATVSRRRLSFSRALGLPLAAACSATLAGTPPDPPQFVPFVSGLNTPIGLTHAGDDSNRLFVNQKGGQLRVIRDGILLPDNYLSVAGSSPAFACTFPGDASPSAIGLTTNSERGLLGVAFHPQFAQNGRLFLSFNDSAGDSVLVRITAADPSVDVLSAADLASCTVLMRVRQDFDNHNGGHIAFGPDGYLYFALGDGGSGNDPCARSQTLAPADLLNSGSCATSSGFINSGGNPDSRALLGKMLRIDVDATTAAGSGQLCGRPRLGQPAAYGIPPGNPGAGGTLAAACDEVWSYGLRNPWRFSFDRETGDMWIGDVGQSTREEINLEPAGAGGRNYGWRCREGLLATTNPCSPPVVAYTDPVIEYPTAGDTRSVTGGFRYRGPVLAAQGLYFYGDFVSSRVWAAAPQPGGGWAHPSTVFQQPSGNLFSFGEGEDGELYGLFGGSVLLLDGSRVAPDFLFANGFEP